MSRGRPGRLRRLFAASLALGLAGAAASRAEDAPAPSKQQLEAMAGQVMKEVAKLRGLPVKATVAVELADRPHVLAYVEKRLEETGELARLELVARLWKRIGLYPESKDLVAEIKAAYSSQIGGYYDPEKDTFFVASWVPMELQRTVMSHELVHALQDQNFELEAMMEPVPGDQDRELATGALIEGDAFAAMLEHSMGRGIGEMGDLVALTKLSMAFGGDAAGMAMPEGLSDVLKEIMVFPYVYGATFLQAKVAAEGWSAVDPAYAAPPRTTEQILHPDKYWGKRDDPRTVSLEPLERGRQLGEPACREVLGQFLTFLWLRQGLAEDRAARASSGWDGDLTAIYGEEGRETVLWRSLWDSPDEAREMAEALIALLSGDAGEAPSVAKWSGAPGAAFATPRGPALVLVAGDELSLVLGPPGAGNAAAPPPAATK